MAENKIIKAENENEKKGLPYSSELYNVITYIRDTLSKELPTLTIDLNYFILGVLAQKNNLLYERLDKILMGNVLDAIYTSFYQAVSTKALSAVKNGRVPSFDKMVEEILVDAERQATGLGDSEISTEHVFLSILENDSPKNKVRTVFNKAGITYGVIRSKMLSVSDDFESPDIRLTKGTPKNKFNVTKKGNVKIISLGAMSESEAKDVMNAINITPTGDIEEDYDDTITELEYRISTAADEEEEAYYESLKTEVEEQYTDYMYSQSRNDMFIGSGQLSSINRFMMI